MINFNRNSIWNRPNFIESAKFEHAKGLDDDFIEKLRKESIKVETGIFKG
ncbi:hypothetical protein KHQ81_08250 [Mycoplasmatota bacterium]|nr:hypothetical protein KHQ81_08250 [Mycoplasmatota bacterium]